MVSELIEMPICDYCGIGNPNLKRCGDCLSAAYCNKTCQIAHWTHHQAHCTSKTKDSSNFIQKLSSGTTDPDVNGCSNSGRVVSVCPVVDDPDNPGFGVLTGSLTGRLVNFQTGRTYQFDGQEVLRR